MPVGDGVAYGFGNVGREGEGAALGAGGAEAALLAGKGKQELLGAVRTAPAGEAGTEVATAQEGLNGLIEVVVVNCLIAAKIGPVAIQDLPDG